MENFLNQLLGSKAKNIAQRTVEALLTISCIWTANAIAQTTNVHVMVSEVSDRRTTGQFFAGSEIKLKLVGDGLADIRGVRRIQITKAIDDTGRNLVTEEKFSSAGPFGFERIGKVSSQIEETIKLGNPARKATVIKEILGSIELYAPQKDSSASVTVKNFTAQNGKPLALPALHERNIAITVLNKAQYEKMKKENDERVAKKEASPEIADAFANVFKQLFSGFMRVRENDLAFVINDPNSGLVDIEINDEQGVAYKRGARFSSEGIHVLSFDRKIDEKAQLVIFLATPKSITKVPLLLKDISLP
jgi:hypothetical protein